MPSPEKVRKSARVEENNEEEDQVFDAPNAQKIKKKKKYGGQLFHLGDSVCLGGGGFFLSLSLLFSFSRGGGGLFFEFRVLSST